MINEWCDKIETRLTGDAGSEKLYRGLIDHVWFLSAQGRWLLRQGRRKKKDNVSFAEAPSVN